MEITENDFEDYEAVRESGATNMLNINNICMLSGLTRQRVMEIIKNYDKYEKKYPNVRIDDLED